MELNETKIGGRCGKTGEPHIRGIVCNVSNCQYHDCETHCTAKQILVGPSRAENSSDTACATFKPKFE